MPTDLPVRELPMSRRRMLRSVVIAGILVLASLAAALAGRSAGWVGVVLFLMAMLRFGLELRRPPTLTVTPDGFALTGIGGYRRSWTDCERFSAWGGLRGRHSVVYRTTLSAKPRLRTANRVLVKGDEALRPGFGGLAAPQLAEMLNQYRGAV